MRLVAEVAGVHYYDDTVSITPESTADTIISIPTDKVIILGGSAQEVSFDALAQVIEDNSVIHVLLIGYAGVKISEALAKVGFTHFTIMSELNMKKIIDTAYHLTESGDTFIFSPGCDISDLFLDAGSVFEQAVIHLKERVNGQKQ